MKIVHICLDSIVTDGFSYQDNLLPKYHLKLGYDVTVITSQWIYNKNGKLDKFKNTNYYNRDNVKIIRLKSMFGTFKSKFKLYSGIFRELNNERPDILFIHGFQYLDIIKIALYLKKHRRIITYIDNHSDYSNSASNWVSKNIFHKLIWANLAKFIEPYTLKFYGVLPARVKILYELYKLPKEKCYLLQMGGDDELVELYSNAESIKLTRMRYGIEENDFLIVSGGKIDKAKIQTLLLMKAICEISNPKIKLIIFGSISDELQEKFKSLLDGNMIKYIGWIDNNESYKIFSAANLVVFPGRHSVYWEQVASQGIPMICKYWDDTNHIDLGGNVIFLYKDDILEIESLILDLYNNASKLKYMKYIANKYGKSKFLYSNIAKRSIE